MEFPVVRNFKPLRVIPEILRESAERHSELVALQMQQKDRTWLKLTYGELVDKVARIASFYASLGLKEGDRISVIGHNSPHWGMAQLALMWLGGIAVPLDPRLTIHELKRIIQHAGVSAVVADEGYIDDILEISEDVPSLKHVIGMMASSSDDIPSIEEASGNFQPIEYPQIQIDNLAMILYTSGTTGVAKGVMLSHRNFAAQVSSMFAAFDYGPGDIFFSVLPLHHVFEFTTGFLAPLDAGSTIVYARSLKSRVLKEDLLAVRPTVMLVVPLLMEKIVEGIHKEVSRSSGVKRFAFNGLRSISKVGGRKAARLFFKSVRARIGMDRLKYLISGGAAMPRWVSQELEIMGFPILQGYGLTEAAPVVSVNPPNRPKNESVGLPLPGVKVKIVNQNIEGIGEIAVRGDNVMVGYYKNPSATEKTIVDGWLMTGDLGRMDIDGYIYVVGRKKAVIVTKGGKNIYPEEIEEVIGESPFVAEVVVLLGRNPVNGKEELQAIVYPNFDYIESYAKGKNIDVFSDEDIQKLVETDVMKRTQVLADYKRPKRVVIRYEEFPKTTTRKIKRYMVEQAG